jgi:hypothetical protein
LPFCADGIVKRFLERISLNHYVRLKQQKMAEDSEKRNLVDAAMVIGEVRTRALSK